MLTGTLFYPTFWERARKILKVGFGGFFGVFNLFQDSKLPQHVFVFRICFNMKQGFKICNKKKLPVIIRQFLSNILYTSCIQKIYCVHLWDIISPKIVNSLCISTNVSKTVYFHYSLIKKIT